MRRVDLPSDVAGRLFLHSMPGRNEPFAKAREAIVGSSVRHVVCLTPDAEIREKSPDYADAIAAGLPWRHVSLPVPDFGIPEDMTTFRDAAAGIAQSLRRGENVLVHCAAGIGRTGTFAAAVLCQLGLAVRDAQRRVRLAGSQSESPEQLVFLENICGCDE